MDYDDFAEKAFLSPRPKGWRPKPGDIVLCRVKRRYTPYRVTVLRRQGVRKHKDYKTDETWILPTYLIYDGRFRAQGFGRHRQEFRVLSLQSLRPTPQKISRHDVLTLMLASLINKN